MILFQSSDDEGDEEKGIEIDLSVCFCTVTVSFYFQVHSYFHFQIDLCQHILHLPSHHCNYSIILKCHNFLSTLNLISFPSLPVPSQSAVVTTSGKDAIEALNISQTSNLSNISNLVPEDIMNKELRGESDEFKDLVTEELKNIELAEQMEKRRKSRQ